MKKIKITIKTPRAVINAHTQFESKNEAEKHGWGFWFQHDNYLILAKDNRIGAIVLVKPR